MELNKETLKQARRAPTPATHRAVLAALDVLDKQPVHTTFTLPRWAVATAAAAIMVALVAAVPPLRHRVTNLALDALGRTIPQADRVNPAAGGVAPLPSAKDPSQNDTSVFLLHRDEYPYKYLAEIATIVEANQTVNGITATVKEAALTVDQLYFVIAVTDQPAHSDIWRGFTLVVNGKHTEYTGFGDGTYYYVSTKLPGIIKASETPVQTQVSFDLYEYPEGNAEGNILGSYTLVFSVAMGSALVQFDDDAGRVLPTPAPSAEATAQITLAPPSTEMPQATAEAVAVAESATAAAETTAAPGNQLPTPRPSSGPETTVMPSSAPQTTAPGVIIPDVTWMPPALGGADTKALSPASVDLPEIAGADYATLTQNSTGITLDVPSKVTANKDISWMNADIAKKTDLFLGWKNDSGSFYICTGKYGIQNDLWKASNYVANQWSGEVNGQLYLVDGLQVVLMEDPKGQLACLVLLPSDAPYKMNVNGDTMTIWGTPAYVHHALKTMRLDSTAVK